MSTAQKKRESYADSVVAVAKKQGVAEASLAEMSQRVEAYRRGNGLPIKKNHQRKVWGALFHLRGIGRVSKDGKVYQFNAVQGVSKAKSNEPLCYKYRPRLLKDIIGQERITSLLRSYLDAGRPPRYILAEGPSGTGKSSLASALCGELGIGKFDFHLVKAQDCHVANIDEIERAMRLSCWHSGGKYRMWLIDEAHTMTEKAMNRWLSLLEHLPENRIVIFTTTKLTAFDLIWQSRCKVMRFEALKEGDISKRLKRIAKAEGDGVLNCRKIAKDTMGVYGGNMRAALQNLEDELVLLKAGLATGKPELEV